MYTKYNFPYTDDNKYACWCSGGIDSTLLLYYLMKSNKPVDVLTTVSVNSGIHNQKIVSNIIDKCIELTGNVNVTHITSFDNAKGKDNLIQNTIPFLSNNYIDKVYTGVTANPPEGVIKDSLDEDRSRDPNKEKSIQPNPYAITPFANYDKQWIAERYKEENLLETLLPLTFSCIKYDEYNIEGNKEACGICWWCKEKAWGFMNV